MIMVFISFSNISNADRFHGGDRETIQYLRQQVPRPDLQGGDLVIFAN